MLQPKIAFLGHVLVFSEDEEMQALLESARDIIVNRRPTIHYQQGSGKEGVTPGYHAKMRLRSLVHHLPAHFIRYTNFFRYSLMSSHNKFNFRKHSFNAVFSLLDCFFCPVEFQQTNMSQFGRKQYIRRFTSHSAARNSVLCDIH